jgi:hypothetical protein
MLQATMPHHHQIRFLPRPFQFIISLMTLTPHATCPEYSSWYRDSATRCTRVRILVAARKGPGAHTPSYSTRTGVWPFWSGRDVALWPPSSVKVKNEWSCTSCLSCFLLCVLFPLLSLFYTYAQVYWPLSLGGNPTAVTRWFKYDRDWLCVNKSQFVPVIFEPPCNRINHIRRLYCENRDNLTFLQRDVTTITLVTSELR